MASEPADPKEETKEAPAKGDASAPSDETPKLEAENGSEGGASEGDVTDGASNGALDDDDSDGDDDDGDDSDGDDSDGDDGDDGDDSDDGDDGDDVDDGDDGDDDDDATSSDAASDTGAAAVSKAASAAKTRSAQGGAKLGKRSKQAAARRSGVSPRNVVLFGALVVLLLGAFGVFGTQSNGGQKGSASWNLKLNEPVDVEITLVATDANDLNCAMEGEIGGLHCGFTSGNARNAAARGSRDDAKLLQPYATTNRQNFLAAGLWVHPELKDAAELETRVKGMPNPRFAVNCKFTPRGKAKSAKVQWKAGSDWGPGDDWYVGDVKDCKLAK